MNTMCIASFVLSMLECQNTTLPMNRTLSALAVLLLVFCLPREGKAQSLGWDAFAQVKFVKKFYKDEGLYIMTPVFDQKIKSLETVEFTLRGYYIPTDMEGKFIIISKVPMANCFFCGGAGAESIVMVYTKSKPPRLKTDQVLTIKGKLRLNDDNLDELNFILDEATIVQGLKD
jgi:hypothetical protein